MKTIQVFIFSSMFMGISWGAEVSLKTKSVVEGDKLMLGQVFQENSIKNSPEELTFDPALIIGRSPEPGEKFILNAAQLQNLANMHHVPYKATAGDLVTIERTGQQVGVNDIRPLLVEKLRAQLPFEDFEVDVNLKNPIAVIATSEPLQIDVDEMKLNTSHDRVSVRMTINGTSHRLNARIIEMINIPALKIDKAVGDIIQAEDIDWVKVPNNTSHSTYILTDKALIGTTPRHKMLKASQPIRKHDVMLEKFVEKGAMVQAVIRGDNLVIQAQARALESGGIGDHIRLLNSDSKKTFQGIIRDKNVVEVAVPKIYMGKS